MEKEPDSLTALILEWQESGNGFSEIIKEASEIIIKYPVRQYNWSIDECHDFYIEFYPLLIRLLNSFKYKGLSFKALLMNTISWRMHTNYRKRIALKKMNYFAKYQLKLESDMSFCASEPRHLLISPKAAKRLKIGSNGQIRSIGLKRQILMLALKNAYFIDDNYISCISRLTGCSEKWLYESVLKLRACGIKKAERIRAFNDRSNRALLNLCKLQYEMSYCKNPVERRRLFEKQYKCRRRIKRASLGKKGVLLSPSNCEIACIMEIPKGSVDSGLHSIKKTLKNINERDCIDI